MLINTKSKAAVIAMINLAKHGNKAPVSLTDLALRQHVSVSHLEQLFSKLRKAGLVVSTKGPKGGYLVNHLDISMKQIANAIQPEESDDNEGWKAVSRVVGGSLQNLKLRDLLL
jgi:Rrf2 family iron-sulfur cluster assembly transcriptional regulator